MSDLESITGVGPSLADELQREGYETADDVYSASVEELIEVKGIGESTAKSIILKTDGGKGRPSKYTAERAQTAIDAAKRGKSKAGCARSAGIGVATLERWLDEHDEFRKGFARARGKGEDKLIEGGLYDPDVDSSMAKFLLSTSFDYKKTEKRELEDVSDGDGFGTTVVLDSEYVDD